MTDSNLSVKKESEDTTMSFKEVKAEELTMNPFTKIGKEWLLITAGNEDVIP